MPEIKVIRKSIQYKAKDGTIKEAKGNFVVIDVNGRPVEIRVTAWNKFENTMLNNLLPLEQ